jgi:hypothetical protein
MAIERQMRASQLVITQANFRKGTLLMFESDGNPLVAGHSVIQSQIRYLHEIHLNCAFRIQDIDLIFLKEGASQI